jgi:putative hemolysin
MESIWVELLLIAASILANGFFAGSEIALVAARPSRLAELRARSVRGAELALALKTEPEPFLATIQIAITLVGTLASAVGGAAAVRALVPWLRTLPLAVVDRWAEPLALGLVILAIAFFSLVLGELTPKAVALRNPERAACLVARPIRFLVGALRGPSAVLTWSTRVVLTLLGQRDAPRAPLVSEEEVKFLIREGAAQGVFERAESELIHRVLRFTDTSVRAIMVPRPSIMGLDLRTPPDEVLRRAAEYGRTRIPVYRESVDDTVGVLVIKDLLRRVSEGRPPVLTELVHEPLFVPETARVSDLLASFQRRAQHLAMVVDEYGRVVGLATMEDVLEEIVGEIREEREATGLQSVSRLADGSYIIDAMTTIRDLRERLGLEVPESPHYQTAAGLLLHELQAIPRPGMTVTTAGYGWTVVEMDGPRVVKVRVRPAVP